MKTTRLRIIGALLGLAVLWLIVPAVRADEDYVTEINRYINQIYEDQKARDEYMQSIQDGIDRVIKQRDELLNRGSDTSGDTPAAVPQPKAPAAEQVGGAPQAPPPGAVPTFRQQFFNGATRTDVTYYRDATGKPGFASVSVAPKAIGSGRR